MTLDSELVRALEEDYKTAPISQQDRVMLDLPKFSIAQGFYYALYRQDTVNLLAFNLDKAESRMEQYTDEAVRSAMGENQAVSIFEPGSADTFSNEIKARYLGTPLWKYALLIALAFLLTEVLLIRFLK